ncbi:CvpA family protein [Pseudonocardia sp. NPDC049635]|uniref:CvpA family protein n=1 Tax=Pseudonocardia sp. NPDC049635 TaxID=3155506 RepID=UPI0034030B8D
MTLLDVLVLIVVLAAAVGGFGRLGGVARAGSLLGLVVGAGVGAAWGSRLAGFGETPGSAWLWGLLGILGGLLLGSLVGRFLGGLVSRLLTGARLSVLDRAVGAATGGIAALLVMWLVSWVVPALVDPAALAPVTSLVDALGGESRILGSVGEVLPATTSAVRDAVDAARPPAG